MYVHRQEMVCLDLGGSLMAAVLYKKELEELIQVFMALKEKMRDLHRQGYNIYDLPWHDGNVLEFVLIGPRPEKGGERLLKNRQKVALVLKGKSYGAGQAYLSRVFKEIDDFTARLIELKTSGYDIFEVPWEKRRPISVLMAKKKRKVY